MLYGKIDRYILIAILVVVIIAVVLIFLSRKENNEHHDSQADLLLAMAEKLRVPMYEPEVTDVKAKEKTPAKALPTEEEDEAIISLADKICFNQPLTQEEKALQAKFPDVVKKRLDQSRQILGNIINKFLSGSRDFDEYEKEFYEAFQEQIDNIMNFKKSVDAIALKISQGITDFSQDEMQFQANHPKQIEDALAEIKKNEGNGGPSNDGKQKGTTAPKASEDLTRANPPLSADERLKIILNIFDDGIPRTVTELATIYAEKAKVTFNKGNMSKIFGKMVDAGQLMCEKFRNGKVYHGPPTWFENKKLKNHYKQKIES